MVGVYAALGVVGVLAIRAPAGLVPEHVEGESLHRFVNCVKVFLQRGCVEQAVEYEIVFDLLCVVRQIELLEFLKRFEAEVHQVVGWFAHVHGYNQGSVEAIGAKQLQLHGVVVSGDGLLMALHVQNVQSYKV